VLRVISEILKWDAFGLRSFHTVLSLFESISLELVGGLAHRPEWCRVITDRVIRSIELSQWISLWHLRESSSFKREIIRVTQATGNDWLSSLASPRF